MCYVWLSTVWFGVGCSSELFIVHRSTVWRAAPYLYLFIVECGAILHREVMIVHIVMQAGRMRLSRPVDELPRSKGRPR